MKSNDPFEERLSRQELRQAPAEWRRDILSAATATAAFEKSNAEASSKLIFWLHELLWPAPRAWAGLAAVWVMILALNLSTGESGSAMAQYAEPSPEVRELLKQQERLLAELVDPIEPIVADRPRAISPRSDRQPQTIAV